MQNKEGFLNKGPPMEDRLMGEKKEELKQQLSVLTARRDRIQKNLYDVEKEINELNKKISKLKD
jgi:chaperonin cofactor prefoldin